MKKYKGKLPKIVVNSKKMETIEKGLIFIEPTILLILLIYFILALIAIIVGILGLNGVTF